MTICVSVAEASLEEALQAVLSAKEKGAELAEVRFDRMTTLPENLSPLRKSPLPIIATLRSREHGGQWKGSDEDRFRFLRRVARAGVKLIDLEDDVLIPRRMDRELKGTELLISHHDLGSTPPTVQVIDSMLLWSTRGDLPKGAFTVNKVSDLHRLMEAGRMLSLTGKKFILIGMGELGEITRLRYRRLGSAMTFASPEAGKETAPGQVDVATLKKIERGIVTGITGNPLGHSFSRSIHHAAFDHLGIAGRYLLFPAQEEELGMLMDIVRGFGMAGLNVTIPHKESVMEHLDEIDPSARRAGAVNVIVNRDGHLIGRNTDISGLAKAFQAAGAEVKGRAALIIGAGGAARACAEFLRQGGADVTITNRTMSRAEEVAKDLSARAVSLKDAPGMKFQIVVNCTPVGMAGYPSELPIDPAVLRYGQVVMDVIYNPERTPFLAEAERQGATIIPGREMLIYQAMDAFEAWTGQRPPYEVMSEAVRKEQE